MLRKSSVDVKERAAKDIHQTAPYATNIERILLKIQFLRSILCLLHLQIKN